MNASAFMEGYMHKSATMSEAGTQIESFTPPTGNPAPQTDVKVNRVEETAKTDTVNELTEKRELDAQGL